MSRAREIALVYDQLEAALQKERVAWDLAALGYWSPSERAIVEIMAADLLKFVARNGREE